MYAVDDVSFTDQEETKHDERERSKRKSCRSKHSYSQQA